MSSSSSICDMFAAQNRSILGSCDLAPDNPLNTFYFIIYGIIMSVVIVCGLIGNAISLAVFTTSTTWGCVRFYLAGLAIWDSALLLTSFTEWSLWSFWYQSAPPLVGPHVYVMYLSYGLSNITLTGCVWVILTLTLERYIATLHPLFHVRFNGQHRAKTVLVFVSICACLYNIPKFFEVTITHNRVFCCSSNDSVREIPVIEETNLLRNPIYFLLCRIIGASLFLYFLPSLILLLLTIRMCSAIKRATRLRCQMMLLVSCAQQLLKSTATVEVPRSRLPKVSSDTLVNENATKMMITVLMKFLFCYALPNIVDLLEIISSDYIRHSNVLEVLTVLSNGFVTLNSSCNFLIYLLIGKKFRRDAMSLLKLRFSPASVGVNEETQLSRYPQVQYSQLLQLSDMMSSSRKLRFSRKATKPVERNDMAY